MGNITSNNIPAKSPEPNKRLISAPVNDGVDSGGEQVPNKLQSNDAVVPNKRRCPDILSGSSNGGPSGGEGEQVAKRRKHQSERFRERGESRRALAAFKKGSDDGSNDCSSCFQDHDCLLLEKPEILMALVKSRFLTAKETGRFLLCTAKAITNHSNIMMSDVDDGTNTENDDWVWKELCYRKWGENSTTNKIRHTGWTSEQLYRKFGAAKKTATVEGALKANTG